MPWAKTGKAESVKAPQGRPVPLLETARPSQRLTLYLMAYAFATPVTEGLPA